MVQRLLKSTKSVITATPDTSIYEFHRAVGSQRHQGYTVLEDGKPMGIANFRDSIGQLVGKRECKTVPEIMEEISGGPCRRDRR
jgi:CBS domain-containing protein